MVCVTRKKMLLLFFLFLIGVFFFAGTDSIYGDSSKESDTSNQQFPSCCVESDARKIVCDVVKQEDSQAIQDGQNNLSPNSETIQDDFANRDKSKQVNLLEETKDGIIIENGEKYYYDKNVLQNSRWILSDGKWMYAGIDGKLYKDAVVEINGKTYGFNDAGIMQTGAFSVGGKEYLADESGALISNRWELDEKGWRYSGDEGQILTSQWIYYSGHWYYAKDDGYIFQNCLFEVNGCKYYAMTGGDIRQNGWILNDGKWYYANSGGDLVRNGWILVNGLWYYAKDDYSIYQNSIFEVDGYKYCASSDGAIFQNRWMLDDGKWHYANAGGDFARNQWILSNGLWYYAKDDCSIYQNCLFEVSGEKYYANLDGDICQNCFVTIGNTKYYFTQRGSMGIDMFACENGTYLYFDEDGKYDPTIRWTGSIVDIAKSQLGINTGEKYWRFYEGTPFVNGQVTPWCGCFIAWCLQQAGIIRAIHVGNMASVPYWLNYFDRTGRWDSAPNPGDVVVYDWKPYDGKRQGFHVGIVEKVKDGFVYTIEGNTGSSYFGEVLRRVRQVGNIYTIGYGRIM